MKDLKDLFGREPTEQEVDDFMRDMEQDDEKDEQLKIPYGNPFAAFTNGPREELPD